MAGIFFFACIIGLLILTGLAQAGVKSAFNKYSKVRSSSGMTGAQAAEAMLQAAGINGVRIERSQGGMLSDHYDPTANVIRLSPEVYGSHSVAALVVAFHEAGHAIQKANRYAPLVIRNLVVPMASFGSGAGMVLIIIGLMLNTLGLAILGLLLFSAVVFFQLVNLPVEFDASARAKRALIQHGFVHGADEEKGVNKVLNAAALTYVAATAVSVFYLLYYAMIIFSRR
ncbi:MAG: zinc metallopeptidase [Candidatus Sumerlaeia bacterium]|nr:zinc metallopeptidase [Candidatus Sumerlaeia bacterium]